MTDSTHYTPDSIENLKSHYREIIDNWRAYWMTQDINETDTANYRRRAMAVDANMQYSLARMLAEDFTQLLDRKNQKLKIAEKALKQIMDSDDENPFAAHDIADEALEEMERA